MLRLFGYMLATLAALVAVFVLGVFVVIGGAGLAAVRGDWFGQGVSIYWLLIAPATLAFVLWRATRRAKR